MKRETHITTPGYTTDGCDNVISFVDYVTRKLREQPFGFRNYGYVPVRVGSADVIRLADRR
ncbi:MAG: hypothetical protein H6869_09355 [Rhodospirillales bacterium]|nr:hypothetical protein [Rhodospirillales bacterium]